MKKILLLSALFLAAIVGFAQHGTGYNHGASGGYHGSGGYNMGPPVMSACDFNKACDAIRRQPFDDDKLRIAEQVSRGNNLTALQVRDFTELMTFESTKLSFAKCAYTKVLDPQNYYVVYDAFTFSSSVSELANYTNAIGFSGGQTYTGTYGGSNGSHQGGGHGHTCSSSCNHGVGTNSYYGTSSSGSCGGGNVGVNGYYGSSSTTVVGSGNGMTYTGQINSVPVVPVVPAIPMCGMCSGHHEMNVVCEGEFGNIAGAVCRQTFESDKILVAKQAIGCKMVSADQVRRLMGKFTFESTKLDFAKWAYRHCWDAQNYYIVNDAFTFSSSVRELDEFIRFG